MVKEDEQIKSIRFLKKTGQMRLPQAEPVDVTSSEYNTPPVPLYEVTKADLQEFNEQVEVYTLIYMNHNYEEIEKMLGHVSPLQFDKTVQKLPKMSRNLLYQEVIHTEETSYEYIVSRFCPPHFKSFMDTVLTIAPVYGMVLPLSDSPKFEDTWKQLQKLTHIFFNGAGMFLSLAHRWRYRTDLLCQGINGEFFDKREFPALTKRENAYLFGVENWVSVPESDQDDYAFCLRPIFRDYDHFKEMYWVGKRAKGTFWGRVYKWRMIECGLVSAPRGKAELCSGLIYERLKMYLGSPEVRFIVDLPQGFIARCNFVLLHVWMLCERANQLLGAAEKQLREITWYKSRLDPEKKLAYAKAKYAQKFFTTLEYEFMTSFRKNLETWMGSVKIHPIQRKRFLGLAERYTALTCLLLNQHFVKHDPVSLPQILQSIFFPHRPQNTFKLFVFQMTDYIKKTREVLQKTDIEQFQLCFADWDINRIDPKAVQAMRQEFAFTEVPIIDKAVNLSAEDLETIEELDTVLPEEEEITVQVQGTAASDEKYRPQQKK